MGIFNRPKSVVMPEEYPLSTPTSDERVMGILSHILAIVPGIGIFGPLVIWLIKKDESSFVEANAKESLNFQLTMLIAYAVSWILVIVLIGALLFFVIWVVNIVLVIVAAVKT